MTCAPSLFLPSLSVSALLSPIQMSVSPENDTNSVPPSSRASRSQFTPTPALWAYLLHKPGSSQRTPSGTSFPANTQIAPVDKAGTSTRILLHDTHARLETFSERAGKLADGVDKAQQALVRAQQEMESEMEKMGEHIGKLVERYRSDIEKKIGEPAQASALSDMRAELATTRAELTATNRRFDTVDAKMTSLNALAQTQSQVLQNLQEHQMRALEQHAQVVALITPLVPLLQAIPLQVEVARNAVIEAMQKRPVSCACSCSSSHASSRSELRSNRLSSPSSVEGNEAARRSNNTSSLKRRRIDDSMAPPASVVHARAFSAALPPPSPRRQATPSSVPRHPFPAPLLRLASHSLRHAQSTAPRREQGTTAAALDRTQLLRRTSLRGPAHPSRHDLTETPMSVSRDLGVTPNQRQNLSSGRARGTPDPCQFVQGSSTATVLVAHNAPMEREGGPRMDHRSPLFGGRILRSMQARLSTPIPHRFPDLRAGGKPRHSFRVPGMQTDEHGRLSTAYHTASSFPQTEETLLPPSLRERKREILNLPDAPRRRFIPLEDDDDHEIDKEGSEAFV
ncbi:hypothetical protein HETIRDRAFT_453771 [Heterobasidion irregulare TC 32-1]|uniref:Uncharacterized protein n=1 Tax=Heterobasidion irregulare (strain TC 32-1) TaxID=747525 RepID=W4K0J4_HETIT|nr:uncharacterized protein HETIRDRAFT_453771 [Heterobasidion irregulare TC 32-1]ETW79333.1 hypothetical protein HETIRDRAFT_453771 [Heterobasidion irregulare TC 32-1]